MTKNEALTMCLEYIETNAHERKYVRHAIKQALADIKQDLTPVQKPRLDQGADYERGFIDGMQKQMQSSVDKAVNAMSQPAPVQEPDGYVSSFESNSPLMLGLSEWERKRLIPVYKSPPAAQPAPVQPVAWDVFNGICHHSTHGTESSAKAMAAEMQKNHDLSGSIAAFNVKPRMSTPTAAPVQEPVSQDPITQLQVAAIIAERDSAIPAAQPAPVQEADGEALVGDIDLLDHAREVLEIIVHDQPVDVFRDARGLIPRLRARLGMPPIINFTTPPAAQQCKWPTCQTEEYQHALAEQIKQELVTGTAQPEWVPVTQQLLNAQHPWLYEPMWIAMKDGSVMTGHYQWMQGRYPDRFVIGSNTHVWAFEATHVMPMNQPKHPIKENT